MEENTISVNLSVLEEKNKIISYRGYENKYEIISKESLPKYKGRKIKKSWYNMSGKLCKKSFIYLGDADIEKGDIVYVDVINGIASKRKEDRKIINLNELYQDSIIFAGYMEDIELEQEFTNIFNKIY